MFILDIKTFRTSKLSFNKTKMGNGSFHVEILYNQSPFMIQFPACRISSMTPTDNRCDMVMSFDVDDNFEYYKFLQIFDYHVEQYLNKFDVTVYTPGHVEMSVVESGFKRTKMILKIKTTSKTSFYDRDKKKMHHYEIKPDDVVIPLVTTKGIFMDAAGANQRWTAKQILRYRSHDANDPNQE